MKAKTRKILGILFIVLPIAGFLMVMVSWPLIAGLVVSFASKETTVGLTSMVNLINVVLGAVGLLCMIMIPVGLVIGLIFLLKKENNTVVDSVAVNESQSLDVSVLEVNKDEVEVCIGNNDQSNKEFK